MTTSVSQGDPFLGANVEDSQDEQAIAKQLRLLETRIQRRDLLQEDVSEKQNHFRNILVKLEHENATLRYNNNEQKKIISTLEGRICKLQNHIDGLLCKLNNACDVVRNIQQELKDRDRQLQQHALKKQKMIQRYNIMIQAETDRMTEEMQTKLREQYKRLSSCIEKKDDKLRLIKQILTSAREDTSNNVTLTTPMASSSKIETAEKAAVTISKNEPSITSNDLQTSKNPSGQIHQTPSSRIRIISNDIHGKATEESNPLFKETPSTVIMDSQISSSCNQIHQIFCHARTNSDDVQEKAEEPILMTVAGSPMSLDSKTEIVKESNSTTSIDSPWSTRIASADTAIVTKTNFNTKGKIPVVNPRYQRMQNADRWIDHRPTGMVPIGTILQPQTQPHKRTIRKLTNPKDFMTRSSRYCLLSQEQDADGELETKLYKADVLPTCGGGAQIVFNDIECLKQISPTAAKCNTDKSGK